MGKTKTAFIGEETQDKNKDKAKGPEQSRRVRVAGLKGGQRRVKIVEAEQLPEDTEKLGDKDTKKTKEATKPRTRSKKYDEAKAKVAQGKAYNLPEAIKLAQETSYSSFDGSVELHIMVKRVGTSANVTLPNSTGKEKRVEVATDETIKKLSEGKVDFDVLLATPDMMPKLVPFARILGPRGMMPNPKNETLISDPSKAKNYSANSVTLKTEKSAPLIHTAIGKVSQETGKLVENAESIFKALGGNKQIISVYTKASMGPSVKVEVK